MAHIEKASPKDAALIADIGRISWVEAHGPSASAADIETYVTRKYTKQTIFDELNKPTNQYHLVYVDGKPAGYSTSSSTLRIQVSLPRMLQNLIEFISRVSFTAVKSGISFCSSILSLRGKQISLASGYTFGRGMTALLPSIQKPDSKS